MHRIPLELMEYYRVATATDLGFAAKENLPPNMAKRSVSISTLFAQTDRLRKQNAEAARDVLAPRSEGIAKPSNTKDGIFAKFSQPKAKEHPLYTSFKEVIGEYRAGAVETRSDGLQPVHDALVARVDGLDVSGRPLNTPGVVTQAYLAALVAADEEISKPLEDDVLTVRERNTGKLADVRLGDTLHAFEITAEQKRAELQKIFERLEVVNAEIAEAQQDAIHVETVEIKQAYQELVIQLDGFKEQAAKMQEQTEKECALALKADKKAKKEWERKIAALHE